MTFYVKTATTLSGVSQKFLLYSGGELPRQDLKV